MNGKKIYYGVASWKGSRLEHMTRAQLYEAMNELAELYAVELENNLKNYSTVGSPPSPNPPTSAFDLIQRVISRPSR